MAPSAAACGARAYGCPRTRSPACATAHSGRVALGIRSTCFPTRTPRPPPGHRHPAAQQPQPTAPRLARLARSPRESRRQRLRFSVGVPGAPSPAALTGERSSPLSVAHGALLVVRSEADGPQGMQFARTDFADPGAPTVAEVADVINARLAGLVTASAVPGQRLRLESVSIGGNSRLEVDLRLSSAAAALGFGTANHAAAGEWGDAVAWPSARDLEPIPPAAWPILRRRPRQRRPPRVRQPRWDRLAGECGPVRRSHVGNRRIPDLGAAESPRADPGCGRHRPDLGSMGTAGRPGVSPVVVAHACPRPRHRRLGH